MQQGDADEHEGDVNQEGDAPIEIEFHELNGKGLHRRVVRVKDPHLVGKVGHQHRQEPGNDVSHLVVHVDPGTEPLEDANVDDGGDYPPEQVGNHLLVLIP